MPLDTRIPLAVTPQPSWASQQIENQNLKALMTQNSEAQRAISDRTALADIYRQSYDTNSGMVDRTKLRGLLAAGGQGDRIPGLDQQDLKNVLTQAKANQSNAKTGLDVQTKNTNDMRRIGGDMYGLAQGLSGDPKVAQQQVLSFVQKHLVNGEFGDVNDPAATQKALGIYQNLPWSQGPAAIRSTLINASQQGMTAADRIDAQIKTAPTTQFVNGQGMARNVSTGEVTPTGQVVPEQLSQNTVYTQRQENARAAAGRQNALTIAKMKPPPFFIPGSPGSPGAAGAQAYPEVPLPQVQAVLDYRGTAKQVMGPRASQGQIAWLNDQVLHYDPKYDFNVSDNVIAAVKKFAEGQEGTMLRSLGNVTEHLGQYAQIAEALDQGKLQLANDIGNHLGMQFGKNQATNYQAIARVAGEEINKALVPNAGTGHERQAFVDSLANLGSSPGQFSGASRTYAAALGSQAKHLIQQARNAKVPESLLNTEYNLPAIEMANAARDAAAGKGGAAAGKRAAVPTAAGAYHYDPATGTYHQ